MEGLLTRYFLNTGIINEPVEWLLQPVSAMWSLIIANTWIGIPFNMILLSTGLTTIPSSIYESANIDGANAFQKFFRITVPLLKPAIESVLVLGFIYTFKVFDLVYVMTQGGPVNATEMLSTYSYKLSFSEFNFSRGAAAANILFAILFLVSLGYLKLVNEEEVRIMDGNAFDSGRKSFWLNLISVIICLFTIPAVLDGRDVIKV